MHQTMNGGSLALLLCAFLSVLPACAVRSISNTGRPHGGQNTTYAGELSDFDIVGCGVANVGQPRVQLKKGQRVLVMQSGAAFPDQAMVTGLAEHFEVGTASGIPTPAMIGTGIGTAAARGGFDAVIAYFGVLESSTEGTAGRAASWIPIGGFFVPDENQRMRIRLRIILLDTRTSAWQSLMPEPIDDERISSLVTRNRKDQEQVLVLKEAAYAAAIRAIVDSLPQ